jgi:hypothetical protein
MALLPSMHRHLCHCHHCNCYPHDNGVIVVVNVQESLLLLRWHQLPLNNGIVTLDLQQCCCPCCDCIVAILKLAYLHSLQWHWYHHQCHCPCCLLASWHCCHQCGGIFAAVAMAIVAHVTMASSPLLIHRCVSAVVELALLPSPLVAELVPSPMLQWHCCHQCAGFCHCRNFNFCPNDNGIIANVDAQTSLSLLRWWGCPWNNGIVALDPQ